MRRVWLQARQAVLGMVSLLALVVLPVAASADDYAIVTSSEIRGLSQNLVPFAASKVTRGYTVHIFDETDWNGIVLLCRREHPVKPYIKHLRKK